jgi:hypothetical protein
MAQATLLLIEDIKTGVQQEQPDVVGLREQLKDLAGFADVNVVPNGRSTAYVTIPARNQRELDRLKAVIDKQVDGWHLLEESTYSLPKTF